MKQGIIIAHGPLGSALIEAAKSIMGSEEGLLTSIELEANAQPRVSLLTLRSRRAML